MVTSKEVGSNGLGVQEPLRQVIGQVVEHVDAQGHVVDVHELEADGGGVPAQLQPRAELKCIKRIFIDSSEV